MTYWRTDVPDCEVFACALINIAQNWSASPRRRCATRAATVRLYTPVHRLAEIRSYSVQPQWPRSARLNNANDPCDVAYPLYSGGRLCHPRQRRCRVCNDSTVGRFVPSSSAAGRDGPPGIDQAGWPPARPAIPAQQSSSYLAPPDWQLGGAVYDHVRFMAILRTVRVRNGDHRATDRPLMIDRPSSRLSWWNRPAPRPARLRS